jgi:putative ABC transport system permease protein
MYLTFKILHFVDYMKRKCSIRTLLQSFGSIRFSLMKNILILPLRSILKQGRQSVISVIGLSIAMASCILIMIYVRYELSYDRYNINSSNLYRVLTKKSVGTSYMGKNTAVVTPSTLKGALMTDIPEVEKSCRCRFISSTLDYNSSLFVEKAFLFADYELLEMFTFPVISGNPSEALREPFSLFITKSMALKYFGDEDPIGKSIKANNKYVYTVKGVLEDIPPNSHFRFDFLTGFETLFRIMGGRENVERWPNFNNMTYVQLSEGSVQENINKNLEKLALKYLPDEPFFKGTTWILQPLEKIHLGGQNNFDFSTQSDVRYIYLVVTIGLIIFLIAVINYMNLATARSFSRGREIGIIKVAGGSRKRIILQLITESLLLSSGALLVALVLAYFILPAFAGFTDRPLKYSMILDDSMPLLVIILNLCMGVFAAFFPALWLSSFNPSGLIKEEFTDFSGKRKSLFLKNVLVGIQYIISIVALVSAFTIWGQMRYIKNKDQGFSSGNILTIELKDPDLMKNPSFLINEIRNNPRIADVCASNALPYIIGSAGYADWDGKPDELNAMVFQAAIDNNFLDFYNLELVSGRGFLKDFRDDTLNNFLINETAARLLDRTDPNGLRFGFQKQATGRIVGVVKDFNFQSLKLPVEPLALAAIPTRQFPVFQYISVKVNEGDIPEVQPFLIQLLKKTSPAYLNPVSVMRDSIDRMYLSDQRLAEIILFSTVLALLLTCLGQYSLSYFTAKKRTKEMGVRKVFGASPASIMLLFSREIIKLILIAVVIAWPVSFFIMNKWLQHYAFRIDLKPSFFIHSLLITVLISIAVTGYQVIMLSKVNPAWTIRNE